MLQRSKKSELESEYSASEGDSEFTAAVSSPRKKRKLSDPHRPDTKKKRNEVCHIKRKGQLELSLAVTGAKEGDYIYGIVGSALEGITLKITGGYVAANGECFTDTSSEEMIVKEFARHQRTTETHAREILEKTPKDDLTTCCPIGKSCHCKPAHCDHVPTATFQIVETGPDIISFAREAGNLLEFEKLIERDDVTYKDFLGLMGRHTLTLRRNLFHVGDSPRKLLKYEGAVFNLCDTGDEMGKCVIGEFEAKEKTVLFEISRKPKMAVMVDDEKDEIAGDRDVIMTVSRDVLLMNNKPKGDPEIDESTLLSWFDHCIETLSPLTMGGLKSALQKAIRFRANRVDTGEEIVPTYVFGVAACTLLFLHSGAFIPELQLFSRGCTAAFKRTAVILVEDGWFEGCPLATLLAAACLSQRIPTWKPTKALVYATLNSVVASCLSRKVLNWRGLWSKKGSYSRSNPLVSEISPFGSFNETIDGKRAKTSVNELRAASLLLRKVRSFDGDETMMELVAMLAKDKEWKRCTMAHRDQIPEIMPICHIVDQHCWRGVGHVLPGEDPFFTKFQLIFNRVTGLNPRFKDIPKDFEEKTRTKTIRFAQRIVLHQALKRRGADLPETSRYVAQVDIDPGVLAAAMGPVEVTPKVAQGKGSRKGKTGRARPMFVVLGVVDPEDEEVLLKPSRDIKDDVPAITMEERNSCIEQVRNMPPIHLRSPILRSKKIHFNGKRWVDEEDRSLSEMLGELKVDVPIHPEITLSGTDEDMVRAISVEGNGVVADFKSKLQHLCRVTPIGISMRALSFMRQEYENIKLPTPDLRGKIGSDQLMAYPMDASVYRFLLRVSLLAPGALRPVDVPRFRIPNAILLRHVESIVQMEIRGKSRGEMSRDASGRKFRFVCTYAKTKLREYQKSAIEDMLARDLRCVPGHFLIMDTGRGKTITTLCYMSQYLHMVTDDSVASCLWVTTPSAVQSTKEDIEKWKCEGASVHVLRNADDMPVDGRINVVAHDTLKRIMKKNEIELMKRVPFMFCVFDEVDTCYGKTQRTSAAHRIAAMCVKLVAQTATAMRSTRHEELAAWLAKTVDFPVSKRNWWVAVSTIIAKEIDMRISLERSLRRIPLDPEIEKLQRSADRSEDTWMHIAKETRKKTDEEMIEIAIEYIPRTEVKNARGIVVQPGGVLLVADTLEHAIRLSDLLNRSHPEIRNSLGGTGSPPPTDTKIAIVPKHACRGYNWAARLGAIVTGVYPGNASDRHQMEGRIRRIGQTRSLLHHVTVVMSGTILEFLHERHQLADSANASIRALADQFAIKLECQ